MIYKLWPKTYLWCIQLKRLIDHIPRPLQGRCTRSRTLRMVSRRIFRIQKDTDFIKNQSRRLPAKGNKFIEFLSPEVDYKIRRITDWRRSKMTHLITWPVGLRGFDARITDRPWVRISFYWIEQWRQLLRGRTDTRLLTFVCFISIL